MIVFDEPVGVALGARRFPERVAVTDERGRSLSYAELDRDVDRAINRLSDMGVQPGDVVAFLLDNRVETVLLQQAAYRGGYLYTPLNPRLRPTELEYLVGDSGAKVLFAEMAYAEMAETLSASSGAELVLLDDSTSAHGLAEFLSGSDDTPVPFQFGSVLSYTSGTTGWPKAVIRERSVPNPDVLRAMLRFGERLGFDPEHDCHLTTAPLYHGGPLISVMHVLNLQGTVNLMHRFDAEAVLEHIETKKITSAYMVPTMYHRLLQLPDEERGAYDLSTLNSIMHTGAPCAPDLKRQMIEWLGPVIYECYAATEGFGTYTVCTSEQWLKHPGTVGKPEHGVITIRDESAEELPAGEIGMIYAQTLPGIKPFRYKGAEEKTAAAYSPFGDYTVGDMGYLDEDGFLYLTGRASDMIISGGVNIYPAEVESVLLKDGRVKDVAVLGLPDPEWGERVVAVVEVDPSLEGDNEVAESLKEFSRKAIASYKCPKQVFLVSDLGRDPSGKIRKGLWKDRLAGEA